MIDFDLTQNQFDALISFTYSSGKECFEKLVNGKKSQEIADEMLRYNKYNGKVNSGLVRRRDAEKQLFLK